MLVLGLDLGLFAAVVRHGVGLWREVWREGGEVGWCGERRGSGRRGGYRASEARGWGFKGTL